MRWSWLVPRLFLLAVIWTALAFGMDPLLRQTAIRVAESASGARVDINSFVTGIFPPSLSVGKVALASARSPGTNVVEFDQLECRIGGNALLRKSFVIEEAHVMGVRFGTVRNDDGQLDRQPDAASRKPSWITEKFRTGGDEWLEELILDVRQQLDPNTLETLRTGKILSVKWEQRMDSLREKLAAFKPRVDVLQDRLEKAKQLRSVTQVQAYLKLANEGESLLLEAERLQMQIQALLPEAGADLSLLDQARKNDQQQVVQRIRQLKPSPRKITESLIGPEVYRKLYQALTWLEFGAQYQKEIRRQTQVVRHRGENLEFDLLNPTPRFLCRRVEFSGELSIDQQLLPFHAVMSNLSSNPELSVQPTEFRLHTQGEKPLQLAIRHDATKEIPWTHVAAGFHQSQPCMLSAGEENTAVLNAALTNLHWTVGIQISGSDLNGTVSVVSDLDHAELTSKKMTPLLRDAVSDVFSSIDKVDATVQLDGSISAPNMQIESMFSEQLATGLRSVFAVQANQLKASLTNQLGHLATEQKQSLIKELRGRYQELVAEHKATLQKTQEAQQLLAKVKSGQATPQDLIRQVSGSGILGEKTDAKVQRQLDQTEKLLQGFGRRVFR